MFYKLKISTQEHSKQVQKLLYQYGFKWPSGHDNNCLYLDASYLYVEDTEDNKYITHGNSMGYFEDATHKEVTFEELQTILKNGVCFHGELIIQYAEDVKKYKEPWKYWEYAKKTENIWYTFNRHPAWDVETKYRRKSDALVANGIINGDVWELKDQTRIFITDAEENRAFSLTTNVHFEYDPTDLLDLVIRIQR